MAFWRHTAAGAYHPCHYHIRATCQTRTTRLLNNSCVSANHLRNLFASACLGCKRSRVQIPAARPNLSIAYNPYVVLPKNRETAGAHLSRLQGVASSSLESCCE